jgi:hypothetical protein
MKNISDYKIGIKMNHNWLNVYNKTMFKVKKLNNWISLFNKKTLNLKLIQINKDFTIN